jgi:putative Flp pilus-assembly TadE/G-like protein
MRSRKRRQDEGAATTILVVGMALVMVAATLIFSRVGNANDLRTQAQNAADAAALAAAAEIRDRGAAEIVAGRIPQGILFGQTSHEAARTYATANDAVVDDVHPTGFFGYTVKVDVHTDRCQTRMEPGRPLSDIPCKTPEDFKNGRSGTATAIAKVTFPFCVIRGGTGEGNKEEDPKFDPPPLGVFCNGEQIIGFGLARKLFTVRLVDEEDPMRFDPAALLRPPGGASNKANERLGQELAAEMGWTGAEWECLDNLWIGESGWNHLAENKSSGAYGIPQSLPPEKMAVYGADYRTNPVTQIRWGLDYIARRYGTPCEAWRQWNLREPHWY